MPLTDHAHSWKPGRESARASNLGRLMADLDIGCYERLHRWSVENREEFWRVMVERLDIRFKRRPRRIMDASRGVERVEWLKGARLNIADSCFKAEPDKVAVLDRNEGSPDIRRITYRELLRRTDRVAGGLRAMGFRAGDAIAVAMPMNCESVAVYLGIIRAGCAAISIADSFSAREIARRLEIGGAKAIFTMDHYRRGGKRIDLYARVKEAGAPRAIVFPFAGERVVARAGDVLWENFAGGEEGFPSVGRRPGDLINVIFSSGTTADPKAIPWTQTTPIKCGADAWLHQDTRPDSVLAWPTNLGWMMGPWLIFAGFMNNAAIALFNGSPSTREYGEFISDAGVTMLGVVPSLVKSWRGSKCMEGLDWGSIRLFSSTGECSNREDYRYLMGLAGNRPVIEYCGGTEIGGGYITGTVVQEAVPAAFSTPALGLDVVILDEEGKPCDRGEMFLVPPSIGMSQELLNGDHHETYYGGCPRGPKGETLRRHGDEMERLANGYYVAHGRTDDTMNLGGIKTGAAAIERAIMSNPHIHETAAIGVPPPEGGPDRLVIYAVLRQGAAAQVGAAELKGSLQKTLKEELNPLFGIHDVIVLEALPRTASGKVMRRSLRKAYAGGSAVS